MIPKYLRFQAFESYTAEQILDFERLSGCGLFLINGETGAGKTAILDAMTYALYGETSGGTRGEVRSLHPLAADIPTQVEFIFSLRETQYKFTRSIRIRERAGKQTVLTEQNALFFDGEHFVPFEANPTRSKVAAKAAELLGLTLEQFRQVILLPQGQFEKFLTSESAEKEEILSTLFGTERFSRISETLYAQSRKRLGELHTQKELLNALLTNEGFPDFEALTAFQQETAEKTRKDQLQLNAAKEYLLHRKEELSAAEKLASLLEEVQAALKEQNALEAEAPAIQALSVRLVNAQAALKSESLYREYDKGRLEYKTRTEQDTRAQSKLSQGRERLAEAERAFHDSGELETEIEAIQQERLQLEPLAGVYSEVQLAGKNAENAAQKYIECQNRLQEAIRKQDELQKQVAEYTATGDRLLTGFVQKIPALTARKNTLLDMQTKMRLCTRLQAETAELSLRLAEMDARMKQLEEEIAEKKRRFDEAYNRQLDNLTELLAKSLKEGQPCPVCGSRAHPQIHIPSNVPAEAGVKQRKAEWEEAQSVRSRLADERNALASSLETKRLSLEQNRPPESPVPFSEDLLAQTESDLAKAQRAEAKQNEINQILAQLKESQNKAVSAKTALEKEQFILQTAALESKSRADSLNASLRADIPDPDALNQRLSALGVQAERMKSRLMKLTDERNEASRQLAILEAEALRSRQELENAHAVWLDSQKAFESALSESGFQDETAFLSARMSSQESDMLSQKLNEYRSRLFAVRQRLEALHAQSQGKEMPELEKLRAEYTEQENAVRTQSEALAVAQSEFQRREKIRTDYSSKYAKYQADMDAAARFREFAELLQGSRGISFTRYVLGVMLSLITAEANRLLRDVHGGRFQIYRKAESTDRSRKTGLELEVQSAMAVSRFSTRNLSGGEKFLISLALSMALSAVLQSQNGGISIDAMFIDEGFGSLDPQSLQEAMGILFSIQGSRRTIGIISHVQELKELIPGRIDVSKDLNGSSLKIIV